jgi:autotransporter-associated beta strand protein
MQTFLRRISCVPDRHFFRPFHFSMPLLAAGLACAIMAGPARAATITGYSATVNDRFASGFPTAPVQNTSGSFIGTGYNWSGVAWSTTTYASTSYKGFGMLSPVHFLAAQHYEYASANELTLGVRVLDVNGTVHTQTNSSAVSNLGQGLLLTNKGFTNYDLAIGTLDAPVAAPSEIARYGVLDLHNTSTGDTLSNYNGLNLLLYGRSSVSSTGSPRIGAATVDLIAAFNSDPKQIAIRTTHASVQLQVGDSGAPALHGWTNPNGGSELTVLGLNSVSDTTNGYNYISFLGSTAAMTAANTVMNGSGYALRVVGNPSNTWVGGSTSIGTRAAWGLSPPANAPSDRYVLFDAATAGSGRVVTVDTNHNLRGLYFKSTGAADDGFAFGGTSTLTIGRGGITNYDNDRQVFTAPLALGDSQYWDGGAGGITAGAITTASGGKVLEITGSGLNRLTGIVSGSGAIAVSGGTLELTAANTYSGKTWVHAGTLLANNVSGSATGTGDVIVALGATLAGAGTITGDAHVSGSVAPGNSIGALSIEGDVTWNAGDAWAFELGTAADSMLAAGSGGSTQDMLQITGVGNDFLKGSGSGWSFDFAGTGDEGWYRLVTWGGTTDFASGDFAATNLASGKSGNFLVDSGTSTLFLQVIPEPAAGLLLVLAAGALTARRRLRRLAPVLCSGG